MPIGHVTKTEAPLNTREQAVEYLRAALEVVDELAPPDELRPAVFTKAADLIAAKQVFFETAPAGIADLAALRSP
jgi:hypothetical protein